MLKKLQVEKAVGLRLAHDLTRIVPGFKGAAFRRGHVIRKNDISRLLDMGKKYVYVLKLERGELHEDQAARRLGWALAGRGLRLRGPREGKIDFLTKVPGLLKVNASALKKINSIGSIIVATRHNRTPTQPGEIVGGTRIIPLTIQERKIKKVEELGRKEGPVLEVLPFRPKRVGVIVTGSEIYEKRIRDRSAAIVREKVEALGSRVVREVLVPDEVPRIADEVRKMKRGGCQIIIATGGLSVDPDDVTLEGIRQSGAEVVFYGVPVLPGSMTAYARLGETVILGAPACVVHDPITALDLFLPRVLAGDSLSAQEIARLGHGGLCWKCSQCRFPICPMGKGE